MSPSGDIKADTKAPLPPVKIEQPVTDKTPSSGHANGQDIATQTASPSNGLGTNEILKVSCRIYVLDMEPHLQPL